MSSSPVALEALAVEFYGDSILAVEDTNSGRVFVPIGRLCDNLGIVRSRQIQRIQEHKVLSSGVVSLNIHTASGTQDTLCLRLDLIPFWLAGINANRVRDDVRERLILYQRECAAVLWDTFRPAGQPSSVRVQGGEAITPAAQAYEMAMAVATLARQQMHMEDHLVALAASLTEHSERLSTLELALAPREAINEAQASDLSQAIKTVAQALGERTGRNEYGGVYGQLYREFGITTYRALPANRFHEAMEWLRSWYRAIRRDVRTAQPDDQ